MRINVPLGSVQDNIVFEPGWYRVRILEATVKTTRAGDGQYISWRLEVSDPDSDYAGKSLWNNTSLKDTAWPILKRFLNAAEIDYDDDGFSTEDAIGCELEVQVDNEEYEGQIQNRVIGFRSL